MKAEPVKIQKIVKVLDTDGVKTFRNEFPLTAQEIRRIKKNRNITFEFTVQIIRTEEPSATKDPFSRGTAVRCKETGRTYATIKAAAEDLHIGYRSLQKAIKEGRTCEGFTLEKAD